MLFKYSSLTGVKQEHVSIYDETTHVYSESFLDTFLHTHEASKILILEEPCDVLYNESLQSFPTDEYSLIKGSPHAFFVEYLPANVTKGSGLQLLCQELNIPLKEVIAFGDGDNDVEFLQVAGIGVAVWNARDVTKAVANVVLEV